MNQKLVQGVLLLACAIALGALLYITYKATMVTTLQTQTEDARRPEPAATIVTRKPRTQRLEVRDVHIPSSALTVAQGWSTTCTVTFVDGTTQVAVVSLAQ